MRWTATGCQSIIESRGRSGTGRGLAHRARASSCPADGDLSPFERDPSTTTFLWTDARRSDPQVIGVRLYSAAGIVPDPGVQDDDITFCES